MSALRNTFTYLSHQLTARNTGGFGVHSPFVFHFTQFILREKHPFHVYAKIESIRKELKKDNRIISQTDFGTRGNRSVAISHIAKKTIKSPHFGQLLYRIINCYQFKNILELGTSLGITTAYLATASANSQCISLEGCPELAQIARANLKKAGADHAEVITGNINNTLDAALQKFTTLDFIFIDANHRQNALEQYFQKCVTKINDQSIIIIDDIHHSEDMENAWKNIKLHPRVRSSIDIYQSGILFFNPTLPHKHYKMRF